MEGWMENSVQKGLTNIGAIVNTDSEIISLTDIKDKFNVSSDFMYYITLKLNK